jgi:hypothetical protein
VQPLWDSLTPGSANPNIIDVINEWLKEPQFNNHFTLIYHDDLIWPATIQCECPAYPGHGFSLSGVGFLWFKNAGEVLARPLTFSFSSGPEYLTNLHEKNCFSLMTERLVYLHSFFERDRPS